MVLVPRFCVCAVPSTGRAPLCFRSAAFSFLHALFASSLRVELFWQFLGLDLLVPFDSSLVR